MTDRSDLVAGARAAVDVALQRSRRLGAGLVAAGLATAFLAAPVAGQVADDGSGSDASTEDPAASDPGGGTDPFDAGSEPVAEDQVSGDDSANTPAPAAAVAAEAPAADAAFATESVEASGDGVADAPKDDAHAAAEGSLELVDSIGLHWYINTEITDTSTTSSASGAAYELTGTTSIAGITTSGGGTSSYTLEDGFDGYNSLCLDLGADEGGDICSADDTEFLVYNNLAAPTLECSGREAVFPTLTNAFGAGIDVSRKVFVPTNDSFARWQNILTNTGASAQTVRVQTANNLGSDDDTTVFASSSGDAAASTADTWVGTFDDFNGDPRLGHVLGGPGAAVGRSLTTFVQDDDKPFWAYDVTIAPGQTVIIVNFATGQVSQAAASAKATELAAGTNANQWACMTDAARAQVANFVAIQPPPPTTTTTTTAPTPTTAAPTTTTTAAAAPLAVTGPEQVSELLQMAGAAMAAGGSALVGGASLRSRFRWRRARHRGQT